MTELENHLLNALRDLSQQFKKQHESSKDTLSNLQTMYERTLEENATLSRQVEELQSQMRLLSRRVSLFVDLYNKNNQ